MQGIHWKVPRHELVLVNGLEKPVMTHGTVLRTDKDEGLEADETDAEHVLRTLEVPQNGYKVVEQEAELHTLGADPYLPSGHIESFLRVFKYFACIIPRV